MKKYLLCSLCLLWFFTACSSVTTPTPTIASAPDKYYPLNTLVGVSELDAVLTAVASGDSQDLISLFQYTKTSCKTVNALGGPPPCRDGEAEGTEVEVLPFLGPEGSYLRKDEINNFPGLNVTRLFAIYQNPGTVFSDVNYPAGEYAVAYLGEENAPEIVLQLTGGKIVRIDYVFGYPESNQILPKDVTDFILPPLE